MAGALTIVGTGIGPLSRVTPEARAVIEQADEVFYLIDEPVTLDWVAKLNPRSRSLQPLYENGGHRGRAYEAMTEAILEPARRGSWVCAAFYGHPGVFVWPSHEAIRRARAEGIDARMLPAVSSEDCLFADLGLDPGVEGCQSYEATRFLLGLHEPDPQAALILWQVGALGDPTFPPRATPERLAVLVEYLTRWYPRDHEVVIYEAAPYPMFDPQVERVQLGALAATTISAMATLYVPRRERARRDPTMARRLGLPPTDDA